MSHKKINLNHVMYVRYKHQDLSEINKFLLDFGLVPEQETPELAFYRGFGEDPVCYVTEQSSDGTSRFYGGGWAVDGYEDLERAAQLPGASQIAELGDGHPIGGSMVELEDPSGGMIYLHWGYKKHDLEHARKPKKLIINTWEDKRRLGKFHRMNDGPSYVHKLGHYGLEVNRGEFQAIRKWYLDNFTLAMTDSLFDPKTNEDVMTFIHVDRGEEFVDHHSFFLAAGDVQKGYEPHHASFEVDDTDSELKGHEWLLKRGWSLVWGIGRHLHGSMIFDYWFDTDGFVVEHYVDADQVNCHHENGRVQASTDHISVWGPKVPLAFLTRKVEDKGK